MALTVNSNLTSLNAQRNLNTSQSSLTTSLQRLSSGLRINSAKDDAAGFAIAERFTSQIRGNDQAARNANDGISLAQTASGDLDQIGSNLQRIRELAVQASNASNSDSDRVSLNNEANQLIQEIDRVAKNSSFNGTKLLDGSFNSKTFQIGANSTANDQISVASISSIQTANIGGVGQSYAATVTSGKIAGALTDGALTLNGQSVGASKLGIAPGQTDASAMSIAAAINKVSAASGVTATASSNSVTGGSATVFTQITADTFSINGINIGTVVGGLSAAGQGANLAAAVNKVATQTGVSASADATTGAVTLTATDGRDINISLSAAANKAAFLAQTGLATGNVGQQGGLGTALANGTTFTPAGAGSGATIAAGALTVNGTSVGAVTLTTQAAFAPKVGGVAAAGSFILGFIPPVGTLAAGQIAINGVATTAAFTFTGIAGFDASSLSTYINSQLGLAGGAATTWDVGRGVNYGTTPIIFDVAGIAATNAAATANQAAVDAFFSGAGSNHNGLVIGKQAAGGAAYDGQQLAAAVNTALAATAGGAAVNGSVSADPLTGQITTTKGTGTMTFGYSAALTTQATLSGQTGLSAAQLGTGSAAVNVANHGTVSLKSSNADGIVLAGANPALAGLTTGTTTASLASSVSSIANVSLLTAAGATSALDALDGALATVSTVQGALGAIQNRFESTVASLQTTTENLTASRSRIKDADFAKETAALSRAQVLQQAGTAMLAQANQSSQGVLSLLR